MLSCVQLCNPREYSPPGPSVHEIFLAKILQCVAISFSRGSSWPRDRALASCIGRRILYSEGHLGIFTLGQLIIWWSCSVSISPLVGRRAILHASLSFWFPISISISLHTFQHSSQMPIVWRHTASQINQDAKHMCNIWPYVNVPVNSWGLNVPMSSLNNRKTVNAITYPEDPHMPHIYKFSIDITHSKFDLAMTVCKNTGDGTSLVYCHHFSL